MTPDSSAPQYGAPAAVKRRRFSQRQLYIMFGVPAAILIVGVLFFLFTGREVSTDDAYVKADKVAISPEVTGPVVKVEVTDNSRVKAGQVLFHIDPAPFQIALNEAQAKLDTARTSLQSLRADYRAKEAELDRAEEKLRYMQHEYERFRNLVASKAAPAAQLDEAQHNRNDAQKSRDELRLQLDSLLAKLNGAPDQPVDDFPAVRQALAALDKAKLDLSRTDVKSPIDGIAGNVTLNPGEYAVNGAPLFTVVDDRHLWVEANFKETQLTHIHPGQAADVKVDVYPGQTWHGTVASITPATGSEFSILPAQNSSGNWVKVVQRIMVRIELKPEDGQPPLAVGMSTNVDIDTGATRLGRFFGAKDSGNIGTLAAAPGTESPPGQNDGGAENKEGASK
ncbi:MAG TPA: HlyD family secretion protein [Alphaproteobacteria bacterium]|nr:HlyD family secretion protein [Alphaproteobacteria bacterium]